MTRSYNRAPGRGASKCKGPEVDSSLGCFSDSERPGWMKHNDQEESAMRADHRGRQGPSRTVIDDLHF